MVPEKKSDKPSSATIRARSNDRRQLRLWAAQRDGTIAEVLHELIELAVRSGWPVQQHGGR